MVHHTRRLAVLTAAAALVLAGCSADEEPEAADTPDPAPSTTEATTPEPTTPAAAPTKESEEKPVEDMSMEELEERAGSVDYDAAREALGQGGYAASADPASCDAMFGDGEDSIMAMFLDSQSVTDPNEALAFIEDTVARIDEVAADAPADMREDFETLSGALAMATTFEGQSSLAQIVADTENATNGLAETCFGQ